MQNSEQLLKIKPQNIQRFMNENKFGKIEEIRYRKNPSKNPGTNSYEPVSIEVRFTTASGSIHGIVFSIHGVANIYDGKKYAYTTDSEERFSTENPEFHKLTYAWTTFAAREIGSITQIESELEYRQKLFKKIDDYRSRVAAVKSHYKNDFSRLEDAGQADSKLGKQAKQLYMDYAILSESLSSCKALQTKCIKGLSQVLEDVKSWE
jgi:hypothetical protein